ncbi:hypothetical protein E8E13_008364 [Curvularia kusanoi]|uniref:Uncharacterized protein n=1 Tax=Curvularia kusanoi TaxID=90978 RepID=A0A9P4WDD3_CURKU|nr:hypothetical protein E8E13_008364 [Curvularia kusanoi]
MDNCCGDHPGNGDIPQTGLVSLTPANSKNKLYFMWDFVLRSFQFLAARVDPRDPIRSEMFEDIVGRGAMAKSLIQDETGKLEAMNASVGYSHDEGVEFTDEIKTAAVRLMDIPEPE